MKRKLLLFVLILHAFSSYAISSAITSSLATNNFKKMVYAGVSAKQTCAQADIFKGVYSIRSLKGAGCKNPLQAGFAEAICPTNAADYMDSGCHKNALPILQSKDPKAFLKQEIDKLSAKDKDSFCQKADSVSPILASACGQANPSGQQNTGSQKNPNNQQSADSQKQLSMEVQEALKFFDLEQSATAEEIKQKYITLALKYHPDKAKPADQDATTENFQKLSNYYLVLQKYRPGTY